jgi:hypothetical protein
MDDPVERFCESVERTVELGRFADLLKVFSCVGIPPEETAQLILVHKQGGARVGPSVWAKIDTRLDHAGFMNRHTAFRSSDSLDVQFRVCRDLVAVQFRSLIFSCSANERAVESCYEELSRKKRQSSGDQDSWNRFLADFAAKSFGGLSVQKTIDGLGPEITLHLAEIRLNDIPGRFAWLCFESLTQRATQSVGGLPAFAGNGHDYEHHIAEILRRAVPQADVQVTRASGDQGADIVFSVGRNKVVIQTKLYSGKVGNDSVQQVYAAKRFYGATAAVVVTNSSFSNSAEALADSLQVVLLHEDEVAGTFAQAYS